MTAPKSSKPRSTSSTSSDPRWGLGDATLRVHALATLIAQADALLADAVADARDQDHPWSDIAGQLGVTADTARRRYSRHHRTRSPLIDLD